MKLVKTTNIWRSVFALVIMFCASAGYSQDLAQAKQLCGNLTAANKAMAQQAGYDLDALCGEVSATGADKRVIKPEPMIPRNTASSRRNNDPYGQQDPYGERDFGWSTPSTVKPKWIRRRACGNGATAYCDSQSLTLNPQIDDGRY